MIWNDMSYNRFENFISFRDRLELELEYFIKNEIFNNFI